MTHSFPTRRSSDLRGRAARAVALGDLVQADAELRGPVEIVVARQAGLLAGVDEAPRQRVDVAKVRDRERAVASVQVAGAAGIAFGAHETWEHAGPVPASSEGRRSREEGDRTGRSGGTT